MDLNVSKNWLEETSYDVIILGSSMTEAILAGALSRVGKKVLHFDKNEYYGGPYSTFTLINFDNLLKNRSNFQRFAAFQGTKITINNEKNSYLFNCETSSSILKFTENNSQSIQTSNLDNYSTSVEPKENLIFETLIKESRFYNIDIVPKILFSRGPEILLFISSGVSKYLEFKVIENTYLYLENAPQQVPCSKGDIFKNKFISIIEKRILSKFLSFIEIEIEKSSKDTEDNKENSISQKSFIEFLREQGLTPKLQSFVLYAISMQSKEQSFNVEEGISMLKKFVRSIGVYNRTPLVVSLYGISEIPQAFCRLSAVFGGIYILRRSIKEIVIEDNIYKEIVDTEGQTMRSQYLILSSDHVLEASEVKFLSRCVCITNSSLIEGESQILITIPPGVLGNQNSIKVLQFDSGISVCPNGKYLVHFTVDSYLETAKCDLEIAVNTLFHFGNDVDSKKPQALYYAFFNVASQKSPPNIPKNIFVCSDINSDIDVAKNIEEASYIFNQICPGEEFLPKCPEPDEIIFEENPQQENIK